MGSVMECDQNHTQKGTTQWVFAKKMARHKKKSKKRGKSNKSIKAMIKKEIVSMAEKKSNAVDSETQPDTTPVVLHISTIAEGLSLDDRIGEQIKAFSLRAKGSCTIHASGVLSIIRIYFFIDFQNTGTPPLVTDLFSSAAAFNAGQMRIDKPAINKRFITLKDWIFPLTNQGPKVKILSWYKKLSHTITFGGIGASDEGKGSIWMITANSVATNLPTLQLKTIFKFTDI